MTTTVTMTTTMNTTMATMTIMNNLRDLNMFMETVLLMAMAFIKAHNPLLSVAGLVLCQWRDKLGDKVIMSANMKNMSVNMKNMNVIVKISVARRKKRNNLNVNAKRKNVLVKKLNMKPSTPAQVTQDLNSDGPITPHQMVSLPISSDQPPIAFPTLATYS